MPLDITAFYAGVLALWVVFLAVNVSLARNKYQVPTGDGGITDLGYKMRAHGNAIETVPLALLLMGLSESFETPGWVVHLIGLAVVVGRVLHGLYFLQGAKQMALRGIGTLFTIGAIALAGLGCLGHGLQNLIMGAG